MDDWRERRSHTLDPLCESRGGMHGPFARGRLPHRMDVTPHHQDKKFCSRNTRPKMKEMGRLGLWWTHSWYSLLFHCVNCHTHTRVVARFCGIKILAHPSCQLHHQTPPPPSFSSTLLGCQNPHNALRVSSFHEWRVTVCLTPCFFCCCCCCNPNPFVLGCSF